MADRVAEIRARLVAATPGPWEVERDELDARYFDDDEAAMAFPRAIGPLTVEDIDGDEVRIEANAALIAAAPADLEWACGEIERLRAVIYAHVDAKVESGDLIAGLAALVDSADRSSGRADQRALDAAYRDGAGAMREAIAVEVECHDSEAEPFVKGGPLLDAARAIRALPIPEPKR